MREPTLAHEPTHVVYERIQNLLQTDDGYHIMVVRDAPLIETIKDRFGTNCLINSVKHYKLFTMHECKVQRVDVEAFVSWRNGHIFTSPWSGLYAASLKPNASFTNTFTKIMKFQDTTKWIQQPLLELEELCHV